MEINISSAMKNFYDIEGMTHDAALEIVRGIEDDLIAFLPECQARDEDYRLGNDTYGYDGGQGDLVNLSYISDRWGGAFRVAWMLGLINEDYQGDPVIVT